jgi:4-diphosphocytidyl-2-C-methyl-D-erythritol kinase
MLKSYSKINLFLKVLEKNSQGLHNIQSTTMLLDLHDEISIKKIKKKKDKIEFKGYFKKNINKNNNTIIDTLLLLRSQKFITQNQKYKIVINKKIPVFAGLGGGTANSVTLIKYFLKSKISSKFLELAEKKIGSDLRLFFSNHSFQKNLKKIIKFKKKFKYYFLLVYPYIKSSTKNVYSNVKIYNVPLQTDPTKIFSKKKYNEFLLNEANDLQKIVEKQHHKIQGILSLIKDQKNCLYTRMTGSGSVCFGIFSNVKSASLAAKVLKKKFPNYWCVATKSI